MPAYLYSPAEATKIRGQLDAAAQSIISEHINDHQSDYDKVRSLHDYLKSNLEYDTVAASSHRPNERNIAEAHNIIGALLKCKCVCEGFAKAFKFLCDKIDLECWVVSGKGSSSIGAGPHAWNIVKINGYYHHVDVTWDNQYSDSSSMPNYGYMNLSDDEIAKDHTWNKKHYPECPSSPYNYFRVNNALLDSKAQLESMLYNSLDFKREKGEVIMAKPQPAKVSYFFGKGYSDLWNTIKESWSRNIHSAGDQFSLACEKGCFTMGGGMNLIAAISIFTFGSLITAFTTFAHIAVLFAFFAFIYIGFGLLWLIDRIYIMINKIKNACPNPDCQAPFLIPTYECPGCGEKHTNLVPSKYGILKRTCLCGTKLPTTFLNGRGQLKAYCPECDTALSGDTASRQYAFPVIGGPSVGKTCFINMAIDQMMSDVAPARSWEMSFISDTEEKDHALAMKSLNQGVRLMKTELNSLTAYQLMLKLPNEKIGRRIYVYDISGEMFSSSSDVQNNLAYSYANGFIFIIDPLTLNQFAMDVEDKVDLNAYGASSKDFDDILNIMLINLEKMFGLKDKDTLKRNLAVVINKVDIPTLEEKIGETAAQQYLAENAKTCKSYMDARDAVCRNFLEEYGAGNFVRTAEAKFKTVRYFTCSALGHNHEGQPYEGKNVVDPVMWLLQQADSSIKAE